MKTWLFGFVIDRRFSEPELIYSGPKMVIGQCKPQPDPDAVESVLKREQKTALPLPWPLEHPTRLQIKQAQECFLDYLRAKRYSTEVALSDFLERHPPSTPCDWAVLAVAYALHPDTTTEFRKQGELIWADLLTYNVAYAFKKQLWLSYGNLTELVAAPPIAHESLTKVHIEYKWIGLGEPVHYSLTIKNVKTSPLVSGIVNDELYSGSLPSEAVQSLSKAITGLLPVTNNAELTACTDNNPYWTITLTYGSGKSVKMVTNGSNITPLGGPWWVSIGDKLYLQSSTAIIHALVGIATKLQLPFGKPQGMYCGGLNADPLTVLYAK